MDHLPRAILFDLDDTLLSWGRRREQLQVVAGEFALGLDVAEALEAKYRWFWSDRARHREYRFSLLEGRIEVARLAFADLGLDDELARAVGRRFHAYREEQAGMFPGAVETIDALKAHGVKLALVTNGDAPTQRSKVDRFDLARRFDHVQIEGEAGFGKPEERAYLHALQALGVDAAETWMVGDNLEWEVAAPQRLGIYAIWHDHLGEGLPPGSAVRPDRIIRAIPEILARPQ